jgi:excisionase family DNA binding protein
LTQDDEVVNGPDFVDVEEAARRLGVSRRTFERIAKAEGLRRFKRPGDRKHYFERSAVDRLRGFREVRARYDET